MYQIKAVIALERFHMVKHSYPATLSNFNSKAKDDLHKSISSLWKQIGNKGNVTSDIFLNYAYVTSYLQTKTFA